MRYALLALLLAGCTTTEMVRTEGERTEYASRSAPSDVAGCFARNIERERPGMIAAVRSSGNGESEVIVRAGAEFVFAVAQVAPDAHGSRAQVWIKPGWFLNRDAFVPAMTSGC